MTSVEMQKKKKKKLVPRWKNASKGSHGKLSSIYHWLSYHLFLLNWIAVQQNVFVSTCMIGEVVAF